MAAPGRTGIAALGINQDSRTQTPGGFMLTETQAPVSTQEPVGASAAGNARLQKRFVVDESVAVTILGSPEERLRARIKDVSRSGLRLELDSRLPRAAEAVKVEWDSRNLLG